MRYLRASFLVSLIYSCQVEAEPCTLTGFDCLVTILELKAIFSPSLFIILLLKK